MFTVSVPIGLLVSYLLLPKIVEWTQEEYLTVMFIYVPLLLGITNVITLVTLRRLGRRSLPLFLYAVGLLGAPVLYLGCLIVGALLIVEVIGTSTGGFNDLRLCAVIGIAWTITQFSLADFVLWVTRSRSQKAVDDNGS
jgi:hypothetical protein